MLTVSGTVNIDTLTPEEQALVSAHRAGLTRGHRPKGYWFTMPGLHSAQSVPGREHYVQRAARRACEYIKELHKWFHYHGINQTRMGQIIGVSQTEVSRMVCGFEIPRFQQLMLLRNYQKQLEQRWERERLEREQRWQAMTAPTVQ